MGEKPWYVFKVQPEWIQKFINKSMEHDEMGGFKIERIDRDEGKGPYMVFLSRSAAYPYVLNELLKEIPGAKIK